MKSIYKKLFLLAPLVLLLFVQAFAGAGAPRKTSSNLPLFASLEQVHLPQAIDHHSLIECLEAHSRELVHTTVERKKKCRYLARYSCASQYLKKGQSRIYTYNSEPASDPDHEPAPDEVWHARPRYYVFLFRLCPF